MFSDLSRIASSPAEPHRTLHNIPGEMLYSRVSISQAIEALAKRIWEEWLSTTDDLVMPLIVMRGGMFFGTRLVNRLSDFEPRSPVGEIEEVQVSSYGKDDKQDQLTVKGHIPDVTGKRVLLIDDICDKGVTLRSLKKILLEHGALEVKSITLLTRARQGMDPDLMPDWTCFVHQGEEWLMGMGMDTGGGGFRGLEDVYGRKDSMPPARDMLSAVPQFCRDNRIELVDDISRISFSPDFKDCRILTGLLKRHRKDLIAGERALIAWEQMVEEMRQSRLEIEDPKDARIPPAEVADRGLLMFDLAFKALYDLEHSATSEGCRLVAESVHFHGSFFRARIDGADLDVSVPCSLSSSYVARREAALEHLEEFIDKTAVTSIYAGKGLEPQKCRMQYRKDVEGSDTGFSIKVAAGDQLDKGIPLIPGRESPAAQLAFFRGEREEGTVGSYPVIPVFIPMSASDIEWLHQLKRLEQEGRRI